MTYDDLLVKDAGVSDFLPGLLSTVKDHVNFKTKPFQTIFSIFGTALLWRFGWIVGALGTVAELFGYGPGQIGALIDDYFFNKGAKTVDNMEFTPSNIKGASDHAAGVIGKAIPKDLSLEDIKKKFLGSVSSNLQDIREIKGYITPNDKMAAFYSASCSTGFIKTARIGHIRRFLRMWRRGNRFQLISSILMKIVWLFAKGLLALGIGGGIASMVGLKPSKKTPDVAPTGDTSVFKPETGEYGPGPKVPASLKYYSNVSSNVKQTLIRFLDATIANFSTGFMQAQRLANPSKPPIPVERAPGWAKILASVERFNWGSIAQINRSRAFVAPRVNAIAKILLSSAGVTGVKIEKLDTTGKPAKPKAKLPTGMKPPVGDEDRLRKLLTGEARI